MRRLIAELLFAMSTRLAVAALVTWLMCSPATAGDDGTLTVEVDPPVARVGQQVGFYLRYEDPDLLTFVHERLIRFGDGGSAYIGAYVARCTGGGAAANDAAFNAMPRAVRSAAGLYHFTHIYSEPGTYAIDAMVGTGRDICPLVEELGSADASVTLTVLP